MANQIIWTDIPVHNLERAVEFYSAILGSAVKKQELMGQIVGMLPQDFGAASGTLVPALDNFQPSASGSQFYLNCSGRLPEAVAAVVKSGGQVLQQEHRMGEHGFRAVVLDSEGNRLALFAENQGQNQAGESALERMIESTERNIRGRPDYPMQLLHLANNVASQRNSLRAFELCRKAMALGRNDGEVARYGRHLLGKLVPGYHAPMINDVRRNEAWDKALTRAIRRGSHVLEIGTGTGMLAMMAARAGAKRVTTCEYHPVVAQLAREIVAQNGFESRIKVISKSSLDMKVGLDMDKRADLVFCDNFADGLFGFRPLQSLADARQRLLKPKAVSLPAAASARVALGDWSHYRRCYQMDESSGFDVSLMADCVFVDIDLEIGAAGLTTLSEDKDIFRFDFSATSYPSSDASEVRLLVTRDGLVNGIVQWIRLELDEETVLEARPELGATFFSNPRFHPLPTPLEVRKGDVVHVHGEHNGQAMTIWIGATDRDGGNG